MRTRTNPRTAQERTRALLVQVDFATEFNLPKEKATTLEGQMHLDLGKCHHRT